MSSYACRICGQPVFVRSVPGHVVPERLQVCYQCDLPTAAATLETARAQFRESLPAAILDVEPVYFAEGALHDPESFEPKFAQLLKRGYSWLNFNIAGLHEGKLVVAIETPFSPATGAQRTSVNFSGPSRGVLRSGGVVDLATLA
jgi:hypothetical protein